MAEEHSSGEAELTPSERQSCPMISTHDKEHESHYFIHQMMRSYHEPEGFRFSFSGYLSAARSITYMLQKEMKRTAGFDAWYKAEQEKMKGDSQLKLLHDLRTDVIHIRALLPGSSVSAGQFKHGRRKLVLGQIPLNPAMESVEVIISLRNQFRDAGLGSFGAIGEEFGIERTWSLPELAGDDIVDFCAATWVKLVRVVSDAHGRMGVQADAPAEWPDSSRRYRIHV